MIPERFFGVAFRMNEISAEALGYIKDQNSIEYVYHILAYLPLLGVFITLLTNIGSIKLNNLLSPLLPK